MRVAKATLSQRHAELVSGMLFGRAPEEMQEVLEATGTSHLFSVSGLHVGLVTTFLWSLLAGLGLRGPWALAPALAGSWAYAAACGMRPAVMRASVMLSCAGFAVLLRRRTAIQGALYLAGILTLGRNPLLAFDPGAQMSFCAVLSILTLSPRLRRALGKLPSWLGDPLATSLAAQIGVVPLGVWYFGTVSLVGVIASVPALTLASMAVLTGLAAGLAGLVWFPLAVVLNAGNSLALAALEWWLHATARLPWACFPVPKPPLWVVLAFYSVLLATGAPREAQRALWARRRALAVLALGAAATVVWIAALRTTPLELVFLSVGQGDASFIRSPSGRTVLVDAGGALGPQRDAGDDVVVPYLLRRGVRQLDVVVATHPHQDHIGGLLGVIRRLHVKVLVKPPIPDNVRPDLDRRLTDLARERGVVVVEAVRGGHIDLGDGARIDFLGPPRGCASQTSQDLNDFSLVMMVRFRNTRALLTGDAGPIALSSLVQEGFDIDADILKVPHHGAAGGCPPELLDAVSPDWAVVPVGPNTFGHPAPSTLQALSRAGAKTFRTDLNGAVTATGLGGRASVRAMRGL
jgi:competence protein ComEC